MPAQQTTGLALYADFPTYVLYRPDKVRPHLKTYDYDAIQEGILGVMDLRDNELFDANEVHSVWAAKGYGPVMYQIAMQESGSRGLIPSRVRSQVTPGAKKVWREFHEGQGKDFAETEELPDAEHHEEEYLNKRYKAVRSIDLSKLKAKHRTTIGRDPYGERMTAFVEAADGLLRTKMAEIYNTSRYHFVFRMLASTAAEYYMGEACAYFALALQNLFGYRMRMLVDEGEYDTWGGEEFPTVAHVYAVDGYDAVDAKGRRSEAEVREEFYDLQEPVVHDITAEELYGYMGDEKPLYGPDEAEVRRAEEFIKEHPEMFREE